MGLSDILSGVTRKTELMDQMVRKLGVDDTIAALPNGPAVMREATLRCLACGYSDSCSAWLNEPRGRSGAPAYCRNHDLFDDLRHRTN